MRGNLTSEIEEGAPLASLMAFDADCRFSGKSSCPGYGGLRECDKRLLHGLVRHCRKGTQETAALDGATNRPSQRLASQCSAQQLVAREGPGILQKGPLGLPWP